MPGLIVLRMRQEYPIFQYYLTYIHPIVSLTLGTFVGALIAYQLSIRRERESRIKLQNREYLLPTVVHPIVRVLEAEQGKIGNSHVIPLEEILNTFEATYYLQKDLYIQLQDYVNLVHNSFRTGATLEHAMANRFLHLLSQGGFPYIQEGGYFTMRSVGLNWLEEGVQVEQLLPAKTIEAADDGYALLGGDAPLQLFYVNPYDVQKHLEGLRSLARQVQFEFRECQEWLYLQSIRDQRRIRAKQLLELLGRV